ncbi:MAG: HRDC domain-containing protein, partial [Anaerolineae bacterium]
SISYDIIRCVVVDWQREQGLVPERTHLPSEEPVDEELFQVLRDWRLAEAQARNQPAFCIFQDSVLQDIARHKPTTLEALQAIKGIGPAKLVRHGEDVIQIVQDWVQKSPAPPSLPPAEDIDPVTSFLSRSHPRPLSGPWPAGWALDFHSRFSGERWARTETGELTYRFKYEGQRGLAEKLVNRLAALIAEHPRLRQVDALVPVPSTTRRDYDPVGELAIALGRLLGLPVLKEALVKTRATRPQKEMRTLAQKEVNVAGAFAARNIVRGKRLLVLDDLYDSGATLAEVTRVLQGAGASRVVVLTLTKTIHTD